MTKKDAFASYYQRSQEEQPREIISHSTHYQTAYDEESNTYTTRVINRGGEFVGGGTAVSGFVSSLKRNEDLLPVSAYGGPDDEWDSSKMAMESALAAIAA